MWMARWIVFSGILIFVLVFVLQNIGTAPLQSNLSLKFLKYKTPEWPMLLWLAVWFFGGVFLSMFVALIREIKLRAQIANLKYELRQYRDESEEPEHPEEQREYSSGSPEPGRDEE